ncbi:hypothetical protein D3C86_1916820 [compost metagenome]
MLMRLNQLVILKTSAPSMSPLISIGSCRLGPMFSIATLVMSTLLIEPSTLTRRVVGVPCAPPSFLPSRSAGLVMLLSFLLTMAKGGLLQSW